MGMTGIHHISIRVQDHEASRSWYEQVLGLQFMSIPVDAGVSGIWRGAPEQGELLATQIGSTFLVLAPPLEGTPAEDRFSEYRIGVDHLAMAVEGRADLEGLVDSLRRAGVDTAGIETDPVLGKEYVAFRDPDNVQWEWYTA